MAIYPKIAAVSYLNTIPFIYGIEHEGNFRAGLLLSPPAGCAESFIKGEVDIALLPSAVVPGLRGAEIITDYCIGATGPVRTVVVTGNTPIRDVRRIWLDPHSRTSVQLAGYLARERWKISPEWMDLGDYSALEHPQEGDAYLLIGDKVFDNEGRFSMTLDLAQEWKEQTHMPFAFAVWVGRKGIPYEVHDALQQSLTFGVEHIYEAICGSRYADRPYAYEYLTRNIDFLFDIEKHTALKKFWDAGIKITPKVNPG